MSEAIRKWKPEGWEIGVIAAVVIALAAIAGATISYVTSQDAVTRVTRIEQSACKESEKDPTDAQAARECQKLRAYVERRANLEVTCVPFERAGYICPKPGSPLAEEHRRREIREAVEEPRGAPKVSTGGGDATSVPSTGHSQPGPRHGGSDQHPSGGGHVTPGGGGAPVPTAPQPAAVPAPSSSQSSSSSTTERIESTVVEAAVESPVREGVGGLIEGAGQVVEGVTGTTCPLAELLCP
jgi:hypothetical protein